MDLKSKLSCDDFPTDSTSSTKSGGVFPVCAPVPPKVEKPPELDRDHECSNILSSSSSSTTPMSTGYFNSECRIHRTDRKDPPNIGYELSVAKSIMQQYSTLSGDNLFDHLSDIIKRVIDERPPNVIDFFEEFSRNVREQKFHQPERFPPDAIFDETRMYRVAKKILLSMKLPIADETADVTAAEEMSQEDAKSERLSLELTEAERMFVTFDPHVQHLQFYMNQCGFAINNDDIFQLACSMHRLEIHPSIMQCRFWGIINGLKASYYIVEASLTREEINHRLEQMEQELLEKQKESEALELEGLPIPLRLQIGLELIPGKNGWENYPTEELEAMKPEAVSVPQVEVVDVFDVPPESIGFGLNRYSYFVVNAVSDDWIELPIVTPAQIIVSRQIKKFFTGDLEAEIISYPGFPGKEKHLLRAMIARITCGTYAAPNGYYRRMSKREKMAYEGTNLDEEEEEDEEPEGEEEEESPVDNDALLLRNKKYHPLSLNLQGQLGNWVHARPNVLKQGRIVWYDEEKARREREKEAERQRKLQMASLLEGEEEEEDVEDEDEGEEEEGFVGGAEAEVGPPLLTPLPMDSSEEYTMPWVVRYSSRYTNKKERIVILQSNVWPGAYTFAFENICESVYMGWGHKYVSRNMPFHHLPSVLAEFPHASDEFIEANDPTVEEEEAYRLARLKLEQKEIADVEGMQEFDDDDEVSTDDASDAEA